MMTEQLFPASQTNSSLGVSPALAMFDTAGSPEGLHGIANASSRPPPEVEPQQQQQPPPEKASVPEEPIPPGMGEGFSVLHSVFKADMCAKVARASLDPALLGESAGAQKDFSERVHEALSCFKRKRKFCEELTWSSAETPKMNEFLRGVRWRVLLGAIPADYRTWEEEVRWQREEYSRLREIFSFTKNPPPQPPLLTETGALKPAKLVNTHDLELFEKIDYTQLKKEIRNDVLRTYMDNPFFSQKETRDILNSVLYVYARTHSDLGYIQGMNEILAPMVYVLYKDWEATTGPLAALGGGARSGPGSADPSPTPELRALRAVAQREYIEHDAYRMLLRVMDVIGPLFNSPESNSNHSSESLGYVEIFGRCNEIQRMLAEKDPELEAALRALGIQPQLYMLRWVRIMFAQVFRLADILVFWDAIFAIGAPYRLVDHICVTLLVLVRDSIIGHELSDALSVLFHYPCAAVPSGLVVSVAVNSFFGGRGSRLFTDDSSLPQPQVAVPQFLVARKESLEKESRTRDSQNAAAAAAAAEMDAGGSDRSWQLRSALNRKLGFFKGSSEASEEEALKRKREEERMNESFLAAVKRENTALAQRVHALDEANRLALLRVDRDINILRKCYVLRPEFRAPSKEVADKAELLRKKLTELESIRELLQKNLSK